ncbi:MAG: hypothetical protein ABI467_27435 [Kofleriaceae bacterium]
MKLVWLSLLLAGACVVDHSNDSDPPPSTQPRTCVADITLDGSTGNAQGTLAGPFTLDRTGVTLCLHLDATQNQVAAHFAAETEKQAGNASPFATVLEDLDGTVLQDSWDVSIGNTDPQTFANLEWNAPLHVVTDAQLWLHARDQSTKTTISVSLFEPLE